MLPLIFVIDKVMLQGFAASVFSLLEPLCRLLARWVSSVLWMAIFYRKLFYFSYVALSIAYLSRPFSTFWMATCQILAKNLLLWQHNLAKLTLQQLTLYTQRKETASFLYHLFHPTLSANVPIKIIAEKFNYCKLSILLGSFDCNQKSFQKNMVLQRLQCICKSLSQAHYTWAGGVFKQQHNPSSSPYISQYHFLTLCTCTK